MLQTRPRDLPPSSLSILNTDLRDETPSVEVVPDQGPSPKRMYLIGHWLMFQSRLVQEPLNLQVVEVGDAQGFHQPLVH